MATMLKRPMKVDRRGCITRDFAGERALQNKLRQSGVVNLDLDQLMEDSVQESQNTPSSGLKKRFGQLVAKTTPPFLADAIKGASRYIAARSASLWELFTFSETQNSNGQSNSNSETNLQNCLNNSGDQAPNQQVSNDVKDKLEKISDSGDKCERQSCPITSVTGSDQASQQDGYGSNQSDSQSISNRVQQFIDEQKFKMNEKSMRKSQSLNHSFRSLRSNFNNRTSTSYASSSNNNNNTVIIKNQNNINQMLNSQVLDQHGDTHHHHHHPGKASSAQSDVLNDRRQRAIEANNLKRLKASAEEQKGAVLSRKNSIRFVAFNEALNNSDEEVTKLVLESPKKQEQQQKPKQLVLVSAEEKMKMLKSAQQAIQEKQSEKKLLKVQLKRVLEMKANARKGKFQEDRSKYGISQNTFSKKTYSAKVTSQQKREILQNKGDIFQDDETQQLLLLQDPEVLLSREGSFLAFGERSQQLNSQMFQTNSASGQKLNRIESMEEKDSEWSISSPSSSSSSQCEERDDRYLEESSCQQSERVKAAFQDDNEFSVSSIQQQQPFDDNDSNLSSVQFFNVLPNNSSVQNFNMLNSANSFKKPLERKPIENVQIVTNEISQNQINQNSVNSAEQGEPTITQLQVPQQQPKEVQEVPVSQIAATQGALVDTDKVLFAEKAKEENNKVQESPSEVQASQTMPQTIAKPEVPSVISSSEIKGSLFAGLLKPATESTPKPELASTSVPPLSLFSTQAKQDPPATVEKPKTETSSSMPEISLFGVKPSGNLSGSLLFPAASPKPESDMQEDKTSGIAEEKLPEVSSQQPSNIGLNSSVQNQSLFSNISNNNPSSNSSKSNNSNILSTPQPSSNNNTFGNDKINPFGQRSSPFGNSNNNNNSSSQGSGSNPFSSSTQQTKALSLQDLISKPSQNYSFQPVATLNDTKTSNLFQSNNTNSLFGDQSSLFQPSNQLFNSSNNNNNNSGITQPQNNGIFPQQQSMMNNTQNNLYQSSYPSPFSSMGNSSQITPFPLQSNQPNNNNNGLFNSTVSTQFNSNINGFQQNSFINNNNNSQQFYPPNNTNSNSIIGMNNNNLSNNNNNTSILFGNNNNTTTPDNSFTPGGPMSCGLANIASFQNNNNTMQLNTGGFGQQMSMPNNPFQNNNGAQLQQQQQNIFGASSSSQIQQQSNLFGSQVQPSGGLFSGVSQGSSQQSSSSGNARKKNNGKNRI